MMTTQALDHIDSRYTALHDMRLGILAYDPTQTMWRWVADDGSAECWTGPMDPKLDICGMLPATPEEYEMSLPDAPETPAPVFTPLYRPSCDQCEAVKGIGQQCPRHAQKLPAPPAPSALPEAPCSTNAYVEIEGVKHQVTARGATGEEMARNFQEGVRALRESYAASVQALRENYDAAQHATQAAQLDHLAACWLSKAVVQGDLPLAQRLVKAVALVQAGAVSQEWSGACTVRSSAGDTVYTVLRTQGRCTCADHQHAVARGDAGQCKHLLAAELAARLQG